MTFRLKLRCNRDDYGDWPEPLNRTFCQIKHVNWIRVSHYHDGRHCSVHRNVKLKTMLPLWLVKQQFPVSFFAISWPITIRLSLPRNIEGEMFSWKLKRQWRRHFFSNTIRNRALRPWCSAHVFSNTNTRSILRNPMRLFLLKFPRQTTCYDYVTWPPFWIYFRNGFVRHWGDFSLENHCSVTHFA